MNVTFELQTDAINDNKFNSCNLLLLNSLSKFPLNFSGVREKFP